MFVMYHSDGSQWPAKQQNTMDGWMEWPLPLALIVWGCGLPKIFGDWNDASNYGKVKHMQCAVGGLHGNAGR